ncbi:hypothetical protein JZ751_009929, partial [Albula glossodonta]
MDAFSLSLTACFISGICHLIQTSLCVILSTPSWPLHDRTCCCIPLFLFEMRNRTKHLPQKRKTNLPGALIFEAGAQEHAGEIAGMGEMQQCKCIFTMEQLCCEHPSPQGQYHRHASFPPCHLPRRIQRQTADCCFDSIHLQTAIYLSVISQHKASLTCCQTKDLILYHVPSTLSGQCHIVGEIQRPSQYC